MVRGTSRRVIVVESPDTNLFEQAIFIVRNDALSKDGVTAQQLVDEACRVARSYTRSHSTRRPLLRCGSPVFWSAAGAHSTDLEAPESAEHLCDKCHAYAACWKPEAEKLWAEEGHKV